MLTSHRLLEKYWHDPRYDTPDVRIWYTDRGAPGDRSMAHGPDITLQPYYLNIQTPAGEKSIPYHRILLITYKGTIVFENQKIQGLAGIITRMDHEGDQPGT